MTDTEKKIAEIREALKSCTFPANERLIFVEPEEDETTYEIVTERGVVIAKGLDLYDAYLFANAPEWLRFLMSELDKRDEENRKLQEERDEWGRTAQEAINTVFVRDHQLQSAQQEIERLRAELEDERRQHEFEKMQHDELRETVQKLIEGLRFYVKLNPAYTGHHARRVLKEIGVTTDA